jgi:hypothetical protein
VILRVNSDYFPKQHWQISLHKADGLFSVRYERDFLCNLNKRHVSRSINAFQRPRENAEFLGKFRILPQASHAALSKLISKFPLKRSPRTFVKTLKSVKMAKFFPLPHSHISHFFCLLHTPRLYLVSILPIPEGRADTGWELSKQ